VATVVGRSSLQAHNANATIKAARKRAPIRTSVSAVNATELSVRARDAALYQAAFRAPNPLEIGW
jgi:hypothetical protein